LFFPYSSNIFENKGYTNELPAPDSSPEALVFEAEEDVLSLLVVLLPEPPQDAKLIIAYIENMYNTPDKNFDLNIVAFLKVKNGLYYFNC
jgi:hypothetical protein